MLVLKENYTRDLAFAKQSIVCSPACPPIPDAVWTDVLANRYVDLDRIFSAVYTVDGDSKSTVKLGDYELTGLPSKPKRRIERHGHWTIAWALYQRAVLYVYPTESEDLGPTTTRLTGSSPPCPKQKPPALSTLTALYEVKSDGQTPFSSPTSPTSITSTPCMLLVREQLLKAHLLRRRLPSESEADVAQALPAKHASASMRDDAPPEAAVSATSVQAALPATTSHLPARKRPREEVLPIVANKRPRRFRGFLWDHNDTHPVTPLATLSESMAALPSPPLSELQNVAALETLQAYPHLFRIVSPLDVNVFEQLLVSHPNRPLVDSTSSGDFPVSWEEPTGPLDDGALRFAHDYAVEEEAAGCYSAPFSGDLLPGMYSMPIHAVPKPHSDKMRFINNHSAGKFSLNSMIDKHSVGMRPDNVQDLARNLLHFRSIYGTAPVWLFKSDIANAYRLLPMHPLWQLKQVVTVNNLFCTFMSLLLWIAIHVRHISCLLAYMDDNFSFDVATSLVQYSGYASPTLLPPSQARLLQLWDDIGVPHAPAKQLFGESLTITGFLVDSAAMTITLPEQACAELVAAIRSFLSDAPRRRRPLREWQRLIGWINWGLNVQPLLRPALQSSYAKISGMSIPHAPIYVNARVTRDLLFIASIFEKHGGIHLMRASSWGPNDADLVVFCDACLTGMAFWIPALSLAFVSDCPGAPVGLEDNIFWFEVLTVLAALEWVHEHLSPLPTRLAIYTDNLNTVQMFDSFRAIRCFDELLLSACELLIASNIDLCVWHIVGQHNTVADALSRGLFHVARQYAPHLAISSFIPPQGTLGG
ncbi:hypothetical protein BN946_scf184657.g1 [Trametes cinnabarina]|uniref:Uncharacterized protein n=1 Tax=Pycnoporus cinnabarinus TaxID=5643 RepID=A0A060SSH0_PYCCI|nr:hypothetical protein BN946_scf184657.g1 [Trametes cinnabarina]